MDAERQIQIEQNTKARYAEHGRLAMVTPEVFVIGQIVDNNLWSGKSASMSAAIWRVVAEATKLDLAEQSIAVGFEPGEYEAWEDYCGAVFNNVYWIVAMD